MSKRLHFTDTEYGTYIGSGDGPEPLSPEHYAKEAQHHRDHPDSEHTQMHNRMLGYLSPLINKPHDAQLVTPAGDVPVMRNTTTGHEVASYDGTFDLWKYGKPITFGVKLKEAVEWLKN
jgi:hypothetical protein